MLPLCAAGEGRTVEAAFRGQHLRGDVRRDVVRGGLRRGRRTRIAANELCHRRRCMAGNTRRYSCRRAYRRTSSHRNCFRVELQWGYTEEATGAVHHHERNLQWCDVPRYKTDMSGLCRRAVINRRSSRLVLLEPMLATRVHQVGHWISTQLQVAPSARTWWRPVSVPVCSCMPDQ